MAIVFPAITNNIELVFDTNIFRTIHFEKVRILKLRNENKTLKLVVQNNDTTLDEYNHEYIKGWNEVHFTNPSPSVKMFLYLTGSPYNNLEIGEIQILATIKAYSSCVEWYKDAKPTFPEFIYAEDMFRFLYEDVAELESGSVCTASISHIHQQLRI
ncbi:DgyrCDS14720 [Dimorphilus gyrociliatus]|uniref:DgyrCDS14717 n=1 Tax=Dimorphilus gyrociliatus TaxID=2664684 RepID=A0A7I8WEK1_9ANNE|nr:DgyrCDS14717 [Dimorphilus gyrociliatus]CAD5126636.1 DgyrCDS14720 [Dimorphilus gyrociliatus]